MRKDVKTLCLFSTLILLSFVISIPSASALTTSVNAWFATIEPNDNEPIVADWDVFGSGYILVVQPNTGPMFDPQDLPFWSVTPPAIRNTILEAVGGHNIVSYYEISYQDPPTNFQTMFPTRFGDHYLNGVASTSVSGEYRVLFVFRTSGAAPQYSCVSDTFVVTGLAVVPEPPMLAAAMAIMAAVAIFTGFKLNHKRSKTNYS